MPGERLWPLPRLSSGVQVVHGEDAGLRRSNPGSLCRWRQSSPEERLGGFLRLPHIHHSPTALDRPRHMTDDALGPFSVRLVEPKLSHDGIILLLGDFSVAQKKLSERGKALRLVNVKGHIRDVFHFSGFDQIFEIS